MCNYIDYNRGGGVALPILISKHTQQGRRGSSAFVFLPDLAVGQQTSAPQLHRSTDRHHGDTRASAKKKDSDFRVLQGSWSSQISDFESLEGPGRLATNHYTFERFFNVLKIGSGSKRFRAHPVPSGSVPNGSSSKRFRSPAVPNGSVPGKRFGSRATMPGACTHAQGALAGASGRLQHCVARQTLDLSIKYWHAQLP